MHFFLWVFPVHVACVFLLFSCIKLRIYIVLYALKYYTQFKIYFTWNSPTVGWLGMLQYGIRDLFFNIDPGRAEQV
jgi:hypothetical protein